MPTTYKILSNILLSRLTPYAEGIIGNHQCEFRCNSSPTDQICCIRQIKNKRIQRSSATTIYAYDSFKREVLYNILIEFGIPTKLLRLIQTCLSETYSRVRVGKNLSVSYDEWFETRKCSIATVFNFVLEYAIRRVQVNQDGLKLNGTLQFLVDADDVNILGGSVHIIKKNAAPLVVTSKETCLEENIDKTKFMVMSRDHNAGRSHNIKIDNSSSERAEDFKYLGTTLTNQNYIQEEIKSRLKAGDVCYHLVQNVLASSLPSIN